MCVVFLHSKSNNPYINKTTLIKNILKPQNDS